MNIYAQRLMNVARATREAAPEAFNMAVFARNCGTPGCAFGNYAARSDLQDAFTLIWKKLGGVYGQFEWYPIALETAQFESACDPSILDHFGISQREAMELFCVSGCGGAGRDKDKAAAYIERFVARKWPESVARPTPPSGSST